MLRFVRILPLLAVLGLLACDSEAPASDAGGGIDAGAVSDAGAGDAGADGATDAGRPDAGPFPDAGSFDAGLDCAFVPCGATPLCGASCTAACGCCSCSGAGFCIGDTAYNCDGGTCLQVTLCPVDECVVNDSGVALCEGACSDIEAEYQAALTTGAVCSVSADTCHVVNGHCGVGLGGCYHAVNDGVTQGALNEIAGRWSGLSCDVGRPVCDCAVPPSSASCVADSCAFPSP